MNYYFVAAGAFGFLGGLAHTFLGDRWTIAPLDPAKVASSQFTGDQNKRFIRWFWHVGSVVLLSTTLLLILQGLGTVAVHEHLMMYVSFLWLGTTAVFFVVALQPPAQAFKMIPGLVGIPINALILAGLFA